MITVDTCMMAGLGGVRIQGWIEIIHTVGGGVRDVCGESLDIITNTGVACIVRLVFTGLAEDRFGFIAIGTGTTVETAGDTGLELEVKRKPATASQTTTYIEGDTALLEAVFSSADGLSGSHDISEAGVFNASTRGDMLARKTFTPITVNWDRGDTLTVRYYVNISR